MRIQPITHNTLAETVASKLVRTLAEPGRSLAYVVKAYSDQAAPAAA